MTVEQPLPSCRRVPRGLRCVMCTRPMTWVTGAGRRETHRSGYLCSSCRRRSGRLRHSHSLPGRPPPRRQHRLGMPV